jgi:hypothetical protein
VNPDCPQTLASAQSGTSALNGQQGRLVYMGDLNRPGFTGERLVQMLSRFFRGVQGFVEVHLCFLRRDVSDFTVQAIFVVPVYPFQGFPFDLTDGFPWPHEVYDFGFEQADCAFGQGIVIAVTDASHGGVDTGLS